MNKILDILIPRFITEDVALVECDEGYEIACSMKDVQPWEDFHGVVTMQCFNFFGFGLFPKKVGHVREFINPHDSRLDV
jgi:hypothetical protein